MFKVREKTLTNFSAASIWNTDRNKGSQWKYYLHCKFNYINQKRFLATYNSGY